MRGWLVISVLALAGCGEHLGWNPNYQFGGGDYGKYKAEREAALVADKEPPATIPLALPIKAPTGAQIAGKDPVPVPRTMKARGGRTVAKKAAPAAAAAATTELPVTQSGPYAGSTPVLVRYAFEANHQPGDSVYPRNGGSAAKAAQVCATFPSTNAAQTAFLASGGPARDPQGMDPDGDGFVCGWDPEPFRKSEL